MVIKRWFEKWKFIEATVLRGIENGAKLLNKYAFQNKFDAIFVPKKITTRTNIATAWHIRVGQFVFIAAPLSAIYLLFFNHILTQNYKTAQEFHLNSALQAMQGATEETQPKSKVIETQGGTESLYSEYYAKYNHNMRVRQTMQDRAIALLNEWELIRNNNNLKNIS